MFVRVLCTVAVATGLLLGAIGVLVLPSAVVGWVGLAVLIGLLVGIGTHGGGTGHVPDAVVVARRAGIIAAAATMAGCLVLTGLVALLGPITGLAILTLGLVAAPWAAWRWLQRRRGQPDTTVGGVTLHDGIPTAPQLAPEALSTAELCLAWQRSYFALLYIPPGAARFGVVCLRQGLLDELERRDPNGFARWLDAGPRAGGNPGSYVAAD